MAKKIKKYKVGLESETYAISLVESPAIEETLVALEEQKEIKVQLANEEKHMVYSAVLVPDKPIYRRNEDGDEYYVEFTKESIEHMSQQFFKEYKQNEITLDHETTASDITVVESWLKSDLYKDFATLYLMKKVESNFDNEHFYLFRVKELTPGMTYKKLSESTNLKGVRQKVVEVKKWLQQNVTKEDINNAFMKMYGDLC